MRLNHHKSKCKICRSANSGALIELIKECKQEGMTMHQIHEELQKKDPSIKFSSFKRHQDFFRKYTKDTVDQIINKDVKLEVSNKINRMAFFKTLMEEAGKVLNTNKKNQIRPKDIVALAINASENLRKEEEFEFKKAITFKKQSNFEKLLNDARYGRVIEQIGQPKQAERTEGAEGANNKTSQQVGQPVIAIDSGSKA